jgi:proteasome lid subunit RPN8/RPN11
MTDKAKISISPVEHARLMGYIKAALPHEVSGLGLVDRTEDGLKISSIMLIKQQCTMGSTDLDTGAIADGMTELHKAGEDTSRLRLWWHSHGTGGAFWSTTDRDTMKKLVGPQVNWFAFLVGNSAGEFKCSIYVGDPFLIDIEADLKIVHETPDLKEECEAEVKEKVTIKTADVGVVNRGVVQRNPAYQGPHNPNVAQHGFPGWRNGQTRVLPKGPKYEDISKALDNFGEAGTCEGTCYEETKAAAYKEPKKGNRKAGTNKRVPRKVVDNEEDDFAQLSEFYANHGMTGV